jgi:hypothetical protein
LVDRYLKGLLDPIVTLLEVHKLMYFLQVAGQDLRLNFEPKQRGPFATNLRHVLIRMESHYTSGYGDGKEPQRYKSISSLTLSRRRKGCLMAMR